MPSMKTKKKPCKKRHTAKTIIRTTKAVATLSDRLKIAGIREIKPKCGGKQIHHSSKSSKKRKCNKTEMGKHRNPLAYIYSNDSSSNQTFKRKKILWENSSKSSSDSHRNIRKKRSEKTLNVSLDFIKDCQNYKRKFTIPKDDIPFSNLRTRMSFTDRRQQYLKREESPTLYLRNSVSRTSEETEMEGNYPGNKCCLFNKIKCEKLNPKKKIDDELKCFVEEIAKSYYAEPVIYKQSLCDVAKIDKNYLESVLSLANYSESSKKKYVEKGETEKGRTKQLSGKNNYEAKTKTLGVGSTYDENSQDSGKPLKMDQVSVRIIRDSTKSEVQFQGIKKLIGSQRNSEEFKTEKELAQSKSELKKRKPRSKILKSNNKELIEIPFSSEISQAKDVKEIWRRETKKKSENSLTSNSSSMIPETDDNSKWKNLGLQSYRTLHKLVEEEINKISKKSEIKNNTTEVKNKENVTQKVHESNAECEKVNLKSNNIINKLKLPRNETPVNEKEMLYAKKKFLTEDLHVYEGEKYKTQSLSIPTRDSKLPETKKTKDSKFLEQTIDNWSILNRLEQAFLALGNTTFNNDYTSKNKQDPKKKSRQNCVITEKKSKEIEEQGKIKFKSQRTNDALNRKDPGAQIRKPERSKLRLNLNNNECIFPRRKNEDTRLRSSNHPHSAQFKKNLKKNKLQSLNSFCGGETKEFSSRKGTSNMNSLKNYSVQPKYSSTSTKTLIILKPEKMKTPVKPMSREGPKNSEKNIKKTTRSSHQSIEKKVNKTIPATSKNLVKTPTENIHGSVKSGIPKPRMNLKMKIESAEPAENRLNNQISEKKEIIQRRINDRSIKKRSILSVHAKQKKSQPSTEKFNTIQEKTSSSVTVALQANTGYRFIKGGQRNFENLYRNSRLQLKNNASNTSFIGTTLCEQFNSETISKLNPNHKFTSSSKQTLLPNSQGGLTSASSISQIKIFQNNPGLNEKPRELNQSNTLFLWEKDIRRYREIVDDIMSQYKRIDGFLKHSESLGISSSNKSNSDVTSQKSYINEKPRKFSNELSHVVNLQEYRKKIVTEYNAVPFFEYKQLVRDEKVNLQEQKQRALSVVSNVNKEMDFDVKDYQPKITKVLDSQIYVDNEDLLQESSENKPKDKKLSLQEILFCRDKNAFQQRECLKTNSLPKALRPSGGDVCSVPFNDQ